MECLGRGVDMHQQSDLEKNPDRDIHTYIRPLYIDEVHELEVENCYYYHHLKIIISRLL